MTLFLSAIQFLTILPVRFKVFDEKSAARSLVCFPLVGAFLGLAVCGLVWVSLYFGFGRLTCAAVAVVFLAALTGGLHLDGLADTFDALGCRGDKEKMLAVMRDARSGALGVTALVCVLLLKVVMLNETGVDFGALVTMCVVSRWAMVFLIFAFPYARREGKGELFFRHINKKIFASATVVALCPAIFLGIKFLAVFIGVAIAAYLFARFVAHKLGGVTGDVLGASSELCEVAVLFVVALMA